MQIKQNLLNKMVSFFNEAGDEKPHPNKKDNKVYDLFERHIDNFSHVFYQDDDSYRYLIFLVLSIFASVAEAIEDEEANEVELVTDVKITTIEDIGIKNIENIDSINNHNTNSMYLFKKIVTVYTDGNLMVNITEKNDWILKHEVLINDAVDKPEDN